jgi:hypothetical protein
VIAPTTHEVRVGSRAQDPDQIPPTPTTPVSAEAVASLHNLIKQDTNELDETSRQRLQKHLQKLTNATQLSFAERALLQEHNRFLAEINNEAKPRRAAKADILGTARVMSYEDLERARAERPEKDAAKEAKKVEQEAKKAEREAKKAEDAIAGKNTLGRKRKSTVTEGDTDGDMEGVTLEPKAKAARMSETQAVDASRSEPSQAPVAQMSREAAPGAPEPKAPVARMSDRQVGG